MAAVEYGTIGIRPMGAYNPGTKYDLLNLVEYDGSSYVAHTDPPLGSLPTDTNYWQVSAQGTGKATATSVGTVKPDGKTTEVSTDGKLSVKKATDTTLGLVKGTRSITVSEDGSIYIPTEFERATELVDISSGEILYMMLGKISKAISVTMGLDQNALLKNMLTNMDADDSNKIPTSAYVHKLTERIGMGTELAAGANLTAAFNALNSNLNNKANNNDLNTINQQVVKLSSGIAPTDYDLLSWAKDDPTRRSIWKVGNTSMVGTPDDSVEWCCLNFRDPSGLRGVIIAIQYGGTAVKRRDYFNGAWLQGNWVSIIG